MYKGISSIGPLITTVHLYICLRKSRVYEYFGFARMTQMLTIQEKGNIHIQIIIGVCVGFMSA